MVTQQGIPCLLLLAAKAGEQADRKTLWKKSLALPNPDLPFPPPSHRHKKPLVKGYALLPQTFKNDHPEVVEEFSREHIQVLSEGQEQFPRIDKPHHLFEATLELRKPEPEVQSTSTCSDSDGFVSSAALVRVLIGVCMEPEVCPVPGLKKEDECFWLRRRFGNFFSFQDRKVVSFSAAIDEEISEVIKRLVRDGADIKYGFDRGSVWHFAVEKGQEELVLSLLRKRVPVLAKEVRGWDTLDRSGEEGFVKIVELLLKDESFDTSGPAAVAFNALLASFSDKKRTEMFRRLLESWAKGNMNGNVNRLLRMFVLQHSPDLVELVLNYCPSLSNELNKSTFHIAFLHRKEGGKASECFEKMVKYGFGIDFTAESSSLLLIGAIINDWVDVVQKVVENGADVNAVFTYEGSELPEEEAADYYEVDDRNEKFVTDWREVSDFEGQLSLYDWEVGGVDERFEKLVYRKVCDYDKRLPCQWQRGRERFDILLSHKKYTPLHMAAICCDGLAIEILLKHGANVNAQLGKRTPIHDAVEAQNFNAVKLLLASGANVRHNPELVCYAIKCGVPEIVELLLLNRVLFSTEDSELQKPLAVAVAENNVKVVDLLLKFGGRPNAAFALRRTRETGYFPVKMLQAVLDRCFTYGDYEAAVKMTDFSYRNRRRNPHRTHCRPRPEDFQQKEADIGSYHDTSTRYMIRLKSAGLRFDNCTDYASSSQGNLRDYFYCSQEAVDEFKKRCDTEVEQLRNGRVGSMDATFYDILNGSLNQLAVFAKHIDFVETMRKGDYKDKFPIYSSVLNCQFAKGTHRKELLDRGSKICSSLNVVFNQLPYNVKERVMKHLNNYYLEVLNSEFERFLAVADDH